VLKSEQMPAITSSLDRALAGRNDAKLDAIICVSGGFTTGDAKSPELLRGVEDMFARSVFPSFISAQLAALYLRPRGLLILPGAAVGGAPTPWGLSYGASKSAVHHLVKSLAHADACLPADATVVGIAPQTLATADNRAAMPDAKHADWCVSPRIAHLIPGVSALTSLLAWDTLSYATGVRCTRDTRDRTPLEELASTMCRWAENPSLCQR
jgi:NAD(P)-dependent dehydrogenase (short-subunit alcohol dehydrogenase family)